MTPEEAKTIAEDFCKNKGVDFNWIDWPGNECDAIIGNACIYYNGYLERNDWLLNLQEAYEKHLEIENVKWDNGVLYNALHMVGDDPVKAAIEEDLASQLDKDTLDIIARIFYKHTIDVF